MARFVVEGTWLGKDVTLVWDDGELYGSPPAVVYLLRFHEQLRSEGVGPSLKAIPEGPSYDGAGLQNPMAALLLMEQMLDDIKTVKDDLGEWDLELRARNVLRSIDAPNGVRQQTEREPRAV